MENENKNGISKYLALMFGNMELNLSRGTLPTTESRNTMVVFRGKGGEPLTLNEELLASFSEEMASLMRGWSLDLDSLFFNIHQPKENGSESETTYVAGTSLGLKIDLAKLPMAGKSLAKNRSLELEELKIIFSTGELPPEEVIGIRNITPAGVTRVPPHIAKGICIVGKIAFLGNTLEFAIGADQSTMDQQGPPPPTGNDSPPPQGSGKQNPSDPKPSELTGPGMTKWFKINRAFGKIKIKRIGIRVWDQQLFLPIDAEMQMGPVKLALMGLAIGTSLTEFKPKFSLDGLAISYNKGKLGINGMFYRSLGADGLPEFNGLATITVPKFTLSALGGYKKVNGKPSLFLFAVLSLNTGVGPSFLSIKGIAIGFGIHRRIVFPTVDQVKNFPFVRAAVDPAYFSRNPLQVMESFRRTIPPAVGNYFFAIGLKFSSFKILDSFALLVVSLGHNPRKNKMGVTRLDLLGVSRLSVPPKSKKPIAVAELALIATYDFVERSLKVDAVLTDASYLLAKKCKLFGGFSFYSWFDGPHKGEFVLSLGGYHPQFKPPPHYPTVPRIGFHWQLSKVLSLKGEAYFALLPNMIMAGVHLKALFQVERYATIRSFTIGGRIKASFAAGIDLMFGWKPFFYEAKAYLRIAIEVFFMARFKLGFLKIKICIRFKIEMGAELFIKGPKFSGYARVELAFIKVRINFGDDQEPSPLPIPWEDFVETFLPTKGQDPLTIGVERGLIKEVSETEVIVDPRSVVLNVSTTLPARTADGIAGGDYQSRFGIAPMGLKEVETSHLKVEIHKAGEEEDNIIGRFDREAVTKKAPAALWGHKLVPQLNDEAAMIDNLLLGLTVRPGTPDVPDQTSEINVAEFAYDEYLAPERIHWTREASGYQSTTPDDGDYAHLRASEGVADQRGSLLTALGIKSPQIDLQQTFTEPERVFVVPPAHLTPIV